MGTAKRIARDLAVHSPLSSLHAYYIASVLGDQIKEIVLRRLVNFGKYLLAVPLNTAIPAFIIRDLVDTPFGSDITVLEIIAASYIIMLSKYHVGSLSM